MNSLMVLAYIGLTSSFPQQVQAWDNGGCNFTIVSSGGIACPGGQLPDGQIRLNGSEPTATFFISDGRITDSAGRGCIVTDSPTTQIQCDEHKPGAQGFSIDQSNTILWKGSPNFSACPATDTEYNIYVNPDFGQKKCFNVTLTASGSCGSCTAAAPPPPPLSPPPAATQTVTVTSVWTSLVTVTETTCSPISVIPPPISLSTAYTTPGCKKCSASTGISSVASSYSSSEAGSTWGTTINTWGTTINTWGTTGKPWGTTSNTYSVTSSISSSESSSLSTVSSSLTTASSSSTSVSSSSSTASGWGWNSRRRHVFPEW